MTRRIGDTDGDERCRVQPRDTAGSVTLDGAEVDLPAQRDQLTTRAMRRFTALRTQVYEQIQRAKRGETAAATS